VRNALRRLADQGRAANTADGGWRPRRLDDFASFALLNRRSQRMHAPDATEPRAACARGRRR